MLGWSSSLSVSFSTQVEVQRGFHCHTPRYDSSRPQPGEATGLTLSGGDDLLEAMFKDVPDHISKRGDGERFAKERKVCCHLVRSRRHHDDAEVGAIFQDFADQAHSVQLRHDHIGDEEVNLALVFSRQFQSFCPVRRGQNVMTIGFQDMANNITNYDFVFGHQYDTDHSLNRVLKYPLEGSDVL